MNFIWSKLGWKGDYSRARPLCFANQWIVQDIPNLSSQSKCAKNTIRWFGIHYNLILNTQQIQSTVWPLSA